MSRRNCDCINTVKMVKVYNCYSEKDGNRFTVLKTLACSRTTVYFKQYGNMILTPTVARGESSK